MADRQYTASAYTIDFNSDITEEIREDIKTLYRQYNHTK